MMTKQIFQTKLSGRDLIVEHGQLAKQAAGSVLVRYGNTVVLVVATMSDKAGEEDFFPLTVVFQEKLYSVGKIPGGFLKREGKPSEYGILSARVIDRALRPLFPEGFRNEVQVVVNVFAVDNDNDVRVAAMFGASLALGISKIPFNGPVSNAVMTLDNDNNIIDNPTVEQMTNGRMELMVAGTMQAINMVEAGAQEISEELMLQSILKAHDIVKALNAFQLEIIAKIGQPKQEVALFAVRDEILEFVNTNYREQLITATRITSKLERYAAIDGLIDAAKAVYQNHSFEDEKAKKRFFMELNEALHDVVRNEVRRQITKDKVRLDGRQLTEIRPLSCETDLLPIVHGSALFTRGETQALSIVTLGALGENQVIDGITDEDAKRFMHHYNFPPFCTGETRRMGPPSRREIGHGALGEKALAQIIPDEKTFPYTIRVVSEVLESNGSSSQASICAGTMALMAAGVPIKAPVAGIAMGLVKEGEDYTILTDIQGMEDHLGDMDFKVAGTKEGICALQMDIKIEGINEAILREALADAKVARFKVMEAMMQAIDQPRRELAASAPKMKTFQIPVNKIREVIGPGGKMINQIIENANNVKIDIADDGQVTIYHKNYEDIEAAYKLIKNIVAPVEVGEIFDGTVVKIEKFGAFIRLKDNLDGLLHISKLSDKRVEKVEDVINLNEKVRVEVVEFDSKTNKIKLKLISKLG